jgi:hypothetical protein
VLRRAARLRAPAPTPGQPCHVRIAHRRPDLLFLACRATIPHLLRWLLPYSRGLAVCGLVGALWLSVYSLDDIAHFHRDLARPNRSWTDAIAMTDCATHLVLHGRNPYSAFSLVDCFSRLHLDGRFSTPLQAGAFAHVRAHLSLRDGEWLSRWACDHRA